MVGPPRFSRTNVLQCCMQDVAFLEALCCSTLKPFAQQFQQWHFVFLPKFSQGFYQICLLRHDFHACGVKQVQQGFLILQPFRVSLTFRVLFRESLVEMRHLKSFLVRMTLCVTIIPKFCHIGSSVPFCYSYSTSRTPLAFRQGFRHWWNHQ